MDNQFHEAVSKDFDVEMIIDQFNKSIVDQFIKNKWLLKHIVKIGQPHLTKLVLESDNTINVNGADQHGTALHEAAYANDFDHVKLLLDHNADPNIMSESNHTPLYLLYRPESNIKSSSDKVLKILLARGAKATTTRNGRKYLQIGTTLSTGSLEVVKLVLKLGIDVRARYGNGDTVLHNLAQNHHWEVVTMIRGGNFGDINIRNNRQETPLWTVAFLGKVYGVKVLLREGADVNIANESNVTPLFIATKMICENDCGLDYMTCIQLLLEHGADVQAVSNHDQDLPTVFDIIIKRREYLKKKMLELGKLMLEHLALQEANGAEITNLIQSKIDSEEQFKKYLDLCKKLLSMKIYGSKTLLELLSCSEEKLIPFMRNADLVRILKNYNDALKSHTVSYGNWLQKRLNKASRIATLRDSAAIVICKIMKIKYNGYSFIVDLILRYLKEKDLKMLLSISF